MLNYLRGAAPGKEHVNVLRVVPCGWLAARESIARLNEHAFEYLCAPIRRVTCPDIPFPYFQTEKQFLPDADSVIGAVQDTLAWE